VAAEVLPLVEQAEKLFQRVGAKGKVGHRVGAEARAVAEKMDRKLVGVEDDLLVEAVVKIVAGLNELSTSGLPEGQEPVGEVYARLAQNASTAASEALKATKTADARCQHHLRRAYMYPSVSSRGDEQCQHCGEWPQIGCDPCPYCDRYSEWSDPTRLG
jgi:hypothetical protein